MQNLPSCDYFKSLKTVPSVEKCKEMLLKICMLSGCDYIQSVKGVGFKKAIKLVQAHGCDIKLIVSDLLNSGNLTKASSDQYIIDFTRA